VNTGIFGRMLVGVTGEAGEEVREQRKQKKSPTRNRYLVRG
jgi:hypothetical protein